MKIERVAQLNKGSGSHIYFGYSVQTSSSPNTKYYNVYEKKLQNSGGWTKDNWLSLCSKFKLEFVYG